MNKHSKQFKFVVPKRIVMAMMLGTFSFSSLFADNKLQVTDISLMPGNQAVVSVLMENDPDITTMQARLNLPEGLKFVPSGKDEYGDDIYFILNQSRTYDVNDPDAQSNQRHEIAEGALYQEAGDNNNLVLITHPKNRPFVGTSGEIFKFTVKADAGMAIGDYKIDITDAHFGTTNAVDIVPDIVEDENGSGKVSVIEEPVGIGILSADNFSIEPFTQHELIINLKNNYDLKALQFDLHLPQGLKIVLGKEGASTPAEGRMTESRLNPDANETSPGNWTITYSSATGGSRVKLAAGEGPIIGIILEADNSLLTPSQITIDNITLTRPNLKEIIPESIAIEVTNPAVAEKAAEAQETAAAALADANALADQANALAQSEEVKNSEQPDVKALAEAAETAISGAKDAAAEAVTKAEELNAIVEAAVADGTVATDAKQTAIAEAKTAADAAAATAEQAIADAEAAIKAAQDKYDAVTAANNAAYDKLSKEIAALQARFDSAKDNLPIATPDVKDEFEDDKAAIQAAIDALQADLDAKHDAVELTEESTLDADAVAAINAAIDKMQDDAAALQKALPVLAALFEAVDDLAVSEEAEACEAQAVKDAVEAAKAAIEDAVAAYEAVETIVQKGELGSTNKAEYEAALEAANDAVEDAKTAIAAAEKAYQDEVAAVAAANEKLAELQAAEAALTVSEGAAACEDEAVKDAVEAANTAIAAANAAVDAVEAAIEAGNLAAEPEAYNDAVAAAEAAIDAAEAAIAAAEDAYQAYEAKKAANEAANERLNKEIDALQAALDGAKRNLTTATPDVKDEFQDAVDAIQAQIDALRDNVKTQYEAMELTAESTLPADDVQAVEDAIEEVQAEAAAAQQKFTENKNVYDQLDPKVKKLEDEVAAALEAANALEDAAENDDIQKAIAELEALQDEVEEMRENLTEDNANRDLTYSLMNSDKYDTEALSQKIKDALTGAQTAQETETALEEAALQDIVELSMLLDTLEAEAEAEGVKDDVAAELAAAEAAIDAVEDFATANDGKLSNESVGDQLEALIDAAEDAVEAADAAIDEAVAVKNAKEKLAELKSDAASLTTPEVEAELADNEAVKEAVAAAQDAINAANEAIAAVEDVISKGNLSTTNAQELADAIAAAEAAITAAEEAIANAETVIEEETDRPIPGDVTGTGEVNFDDYLTFVNNFLDGNVPDKSDPLYGAYDANGDGYVNVADLQAIFNLSLGLNPDGSQPGSSAAPAAPVTGSVNMAAEQYGKVTRLSISLDSSAQFTGFQMDLVLPEGMTVVAEQAEGMEVKSNNLGNTHRILAINPEAVMNNGKVLTIDLEGNGNVDFENVVFTTAQAQSVPMQVIGDITTAINGVNAEKQDGTVYDLGGRVMQGLKKGMNIVRDAFGNVRKMSVK